MDYDLTPYLDDNCNQIVSEINNNLDIIMDDLFTGKELTNDEILLDIEILNKTKQDYYKLVEYSINLLNDYAVECSKAAGRSMIVSLMMILSLYLNPILMISLSTFSFTRGSMYYRIYRELIDKENIKEHLSTFDSIIRRISNYEEVLNKKYLICESNKTLAREK